MRYPSPPSGPITRSDYTVSVNYKPVLSAGRVNPAVGAISQAFKFTVTYTDQDGTSATPPHVFMRIIQNGNPPVELTPRDMTATTTSSNYASGVVYQYTSDPTKDIFTPGTYNVVFEATDERR